MDEKHELRMARYYATLSNYYRKYSETNTANSQANKANTRYFIATQLQAGLSFDDIFDRWPWTLEQTLKTE